MTFQQESPHKNDEKGQMDNRHPASWVSFFMLFQKWRVTSYLDTPGLKCNTMASLGKHFPLGTLTYIIDILSIFFSNPEFGTPVILLRWYSKSLRCNLFIINLTLNAYYDHIDWTILELDSFALDDLAEFLHSLE